MALNLNLQGFVDTMVSDMLKTDAERKAELVVESKFDEIIDGRIAHHTQSIAELKAQSDGSHVNSAAITYHERRLARYMS
jgi:hypothetical protein